jgi:Flp pilus assembly protein TadD
MKERKEKGRAAAAEPESAPAGATAVEGAAPGPQRGAAAAGHLARATELFGRGAWVQAAEAYDAALSDDADDLEALIGLGASFLAQAQYDGAEREFRKAMKLAPNSPDVHFQLGLTLFRRGVYAAAALQLRRAIELDAEMAAAHVLLGEALNHTGESEGAIEALEHAIMLQPGNGKAFYALGIAYDRKGQHERAAEMYRRSREVGGR